MTCQFCGDEGNYTVEGCPKCGKRDIRVSEAVVKVQAFGGGHASAGLSSLLMSEAWRLATMCSEIEDSEKGLEWPQPRQHENLGHAAASVILATAALEAAINEVFLQAVDHRFSAFPHLKHDQVYLLAKLWVILETSRSQVIKKHEVALAATGRIALSSGEEPAQSLASLIALRNLLVHFKPEWSHELDRRDNIRNRLQGKFNTNALSDRAPGRILWFPGKCLGAGCAKWACETTLSYHTAFSELLGIQGRFPTFKT